jgi:3-isopropylmalate/(R)-2-methylmalate dehydratase small subunit
MKNVDTDQIIPARYLTSVSREGYGQNVFRNLRDADPEFVFNLARYRNAKILLADSNFGCGSSREHAVWALVGAGIEVVVGKSFADIFTSNSAKNGLLLVELADSVVDDLFAQTARGDIELTVDLPNQTIVLPDGTKEEFQYDAFRKHCLCNGLDDVDYIMSYKEQIAAYSKDPAHELPFKTGSL